MLDRLAYVGFPLLKPAPWPPGWIHSFLMTYCTLPFYIAGFLLTAMPRWQGYRELHFSEIAFPWSLMGIGVLAIFTGLFFDDHILIAGCFTLTLGWFGIVYRLFKVLQHPNLEKRHAGVVCVASLFGGLGLISWLVFSYAGEAKWAILGINLGIWCFLGPIFVAVCHRMIPFFSNGVLTPYIVYKPFWALWALVIAVLMHGIAQCIEPLLSLPTDLLGAIVAFRLTKRWQLARSLSVPLLGMLHIGFAWLGIAFLLFVIQQLCWVVERQAVLGLAPLHAMTLGMFLSLVYAMVSRVSLGHSGNPLTAAPWMWFSFGLLQLTVILRILSELLPATFSGLLNMLAITGVAMICIRWGATFIPIYLRPRKDGKPG